MHIYFDRLNRIIISFLLKCLITQIKSATIEKRPIMNLCNKVLYIKEEKMKTIREIRIRDLITYFLVPFLALIVLWASYIVFVTKTDLLLKIILTSTAILLTYPLLKRFVIGGVLMYKAFAPKEMRDRCRFEPTCSTYMVMAIQKYGLFRGVFKGIKRITRCKPPNGGIDYP